MSIKVYGYKPGSRSAKALADALGARVLRHVGSRYRQRDDDLIINWGSAACPFNGPRVANQSDRVERASNKLTCFQDLAGANVRIPNFWTRREDIPADAYPVMCRTVLRGHSGAGIVVAEDVTQLVAAPLYTQYVKKRHEYRVHLLRQPGAAAPSIIAVQRKARRNGVEDANFRVRNLANGFVYVREGVEAPADVIAQAQAALVASGLTFGAVDVIWNDRRQEATVLEINTAPGLEGQTIQDYANAFRQVA